MPEIKKQNKNVYYDTAASPFYMIKIYKVAKEIGVLDKILFGSDYPLIPMKRYIKEIESSGLASEGQAKIFGENAQKLLDMQQESVATPH